jgi:hypothetical protein
LPQKSSHNLPLRQQFVVKRRKISQESAKPYGASKKVKKLQFFYAPESALKTIYCGRFGKTTLYIDFLYDIMLNGIKEAFL